MSSKITIVGAGLAGLSVVDTLLRNNIAPQDIVILHEGKGPHGVAVLVETATDNPTRTVANVRMYFDRCGGALGTSGSVAFLFDRKGVFRVKASGIVTGKQIGRAHV